MEGLHYRQHLATIITVDVREIEELVPVYVETENQENYQRDGRNNQNQK
jgi:hypothetical protein